MKSTVTSIIISLAHQFDHETIAEGVEFEEQLQYLISNGCDKVQGYLISKPLSEAEAIKLLQKINHSIR